MTEEQLDLLIAKAPALREAGVRSFSFGDVVVNLEPVQPTYNAPKEGAPQSSADPFDDAATYQTGRVPEYLARREPWISE